MRLVPVDSINKIQGFKPDRLISNSFDRNTYQLITTDSYETPEWAEINYEEILDYFKTKDHESLINHLLEELPYVWKDSYLSFTSRLVDICRFKHDSFEYVYDDTASLEMKGLIPVNSTQEPRVIAVYGRSQPRNLKRDDYRLRGWVGATNKIFGSKWDKGHFMAHSIGGAVNGIEMNVFVQRRRLNRGWSNEGKIFRQMERYCFENPNTFCFNRPIYSEIGRAHV